MSSRDGSYGPEPGTKLLPPDGTKRGGKETRQSTRRPLDGTQDSNMGAKDFTSKSQKALLLLVAQLVLGHAFQLKIVKSICLFQILLPIGSMLYTKTKAQTLLLHESLMSMSKEERRRCPPPFVVVIGTLLETCLAIATEKLPNSRPLQDITAYWTELNQLASPEQAQRLLSDFRFARLRKVYSKDHIMMEIGLSSVITPSAELAWKALHYVATHSEQGSEKFGVAPKTDVEKRVAFLLDKFKGGR